ncbi:MAG TPA: phosphatase PAP2 family protein [Stellaceae bacterium]|nr:phosphatase PAP2 family protein [Stellaceae bacterium]
MLSRTDGLAWALVLAIGVLDAVWLRYVNFTIDGFGLIAACLAVLLAIAIGYGATGRSLRLASLAHWTALFMCASGALAIMSYLAATLAPPLRDGELTFLDHALGFDWLGVFTWLMAHSWLLYFLTVGYDAFLPQIILTLVYFALRGDEDANRELVWTLILGAIATLVVSAFFPAACVPDVYGSIPAGHARELAALHYRFEACGGPDLMTLRAGTPNLFHFTNMAGIIALPSFHTIVGVLLIYAHRRQRWLLRCSLALNGLMLLSVPPIGGHYLMDLLAGAAVAGALIAAAQWRQAGWGSVALASKPAVDTPYKP